MNQKRFILQGKLHKKLCPRSLSLISLLVVILAALRPQNGYDREGSLNVSTPFKINYEPNPGSSEHVSNRREL